MTHNEILSLLVTGMLCYGLFDAGCVSVEMLRALCVCVRARSLKNYSLKIKRLLFCHDPLTPPPGKLRVGQ